MKYVGGIGPSEPELMIIGIAPGAEETKQGMPFVGPSGFILKEDLLEAGIDINSCYRTNIFKYQLPENEFKRYQEIGLSLEDALEEVYNEIRVMNPNCILGLGDPPLSALCGKKGTKNGITEWRGSILDVNGHKAVFTFHPAAQLHSEGEAAGAFRPWQKYVRKFDIQRAVQQSKFPEHRTKHRLLSIARSSADVYRFLERITEYCAVDIEAIANIPVCIGLALSDTEAMSIPLWNTLRVKCDDEVNPKKSFDYPLEVSTIPTSDLAYIWKMLSRFFLNSRIKFIGQNFKYDEDKLNRLGFYLHSLYSDILISQHLISSELPKSLAFQTSIYTEESYYKFEGKEFNPAKDKIKDLLIYNCKDACVTYEIHFKHQEEFKLIKGAKEGFYNFRMKLHKAYHQMEKVGFLVNKEKREELIRKYLARQFKLEHEFFEICKSYGITEPVNMASPKQLQFLLFDIMKIPRRKGTGEEIITALLANVVKKENQRRALEIIAEWRRVAKTIGTYLAAELDYDGRMRTTYFITGTESFRSSTQTLKAPRRDKELGWALHTVTKHGDTGNDLRSILVADRGYVFVNIDQSQAEARACSLLADDEYTLELYDTNDIHAITASKVFGGTEDTWSKKRLGYECPERFCGKTARHAYHLGIKKHMLMINMNTDARKYKINLSISEWKAGEILKELAKMTPKIQDVYHEGIKKCLMDNRRLYGTFGASFYLYETWGDDLFKAAYSRIPQQTVSDKTKSVMVWAQKEIWDCPVVGEAHDALLFLCPEKKVDEYVPRIRAEFHKPIDFSMCSLPRRSLVIPTDCEVGYDYEDLRKYKIREKVA